LFVDLADSPCVAKLQIDSPAVSNALCMLAIHEHVLRRSDHEVQARPDGRIRAAIERDGCVAIQLRRAGARADPDKATAARNAVSRVTRRITVATPSSETREARFGVVS